MKEFEDIVTLNIFTKSQIMDQKDYDNPYKEKISISENSIISGFLTMIENIYENHELQTNNGIILNTYKIQNVIQKTRENLNYIPMTSEIINSNFSYIIKITDTKLTITRDYIKIADVFALAGGLFQVLYLIGYILFNFYYGYKKDNLLLGTFRIFKFPSKSTKLIRNSTNIYLANNNEIQKNLTLLDTKKSKKKEELNLELELFNEDKNENINDIDNLENEINKNENEINDLNQKIECEMIQEEKENFFNEDSIKIEKSENPNLNIELEFKEENVNNIEFNKKIEIQLNENDKNLLKQDTDFNIQDTESKFQRNLHKTLIQRKSSSKKSTLAKYLAQQLKNMKINSNDHHLFNNFNDYNEKFNIREIFYSYFCSKEKRTKYKKKQKLREELINDYQNIFDLANFPKLIYEVELLKKILLSKEERNSLEILSIPVIAIDEDYNVCFKKLPKQDFDIEFDFMKYFQELSSKRNISFIEKRLLRLMNKYIIQKGIN